MNKILLFIALLVLLTSGDKQWKTPCGRKVCKMQDDDAAWLDAACNACFSDDSEVTRLQIGDEDFEWDDIEEFCFDGDD